MAVICLAVIALGGILFASALKPLQRITRYSQECLENSDATLVVSSRDEMGMLAQNLNALMAHLNRELAFSQGILSGITVPCSVFSAEDRTPFTNQPMLDLLERDESAENVTGLTSGEYIWREKNKETISTRALRENKALATEMDFQAQKGGKKHVMVSSAPFHDRAGNILGTLSVWIDLTEIAEKQRAIEENARRIAEIAASAQDVANNVSSASTIYPVQRWTEKAKALCK